MRAQCKAGSGTPCSKSIPGIYPREYLDGNRNNELITSSQDEADATPPAIKKPTFLDTSGDCATVLTILSNIFALLTHTFLTRACTVYMSPCLWSPGNVRPERQISPPRLTPNTNRQCLASPATQKPVAISFSAAPLNPIHPRMSVVGTLKGDMPQQVRSLVSHLLLLLFRSPG